MRGVNDEPAAHPPDGGRMGPNATVPGVRAERDAAMTPERGFWFQCVRAMLARPWLWLAALRQLWRTVVPGWWRHRPFIPRPDPGYLRWRMETAYGTRGTPTPADFVAYVDWCRTTERTTPGR
jgi:hypothetical protein